MRWTRQLNYFLASGLLAAGLVACSPASTRIEPGVAEQVRSEAEAEDSVIEVTPLADPDVLELKRRAETAEADGALEEARTLLSEALELAPRDPLLWQHLAELDLQLGDLQSAIDRAHHSYEIGPKVGSLCSRNWLTIAEAHRALDNRALESEAMAIAESCPVRARERL